jgi:hypothetical protein
MKKRIAFILWLVFIATLTQAQFEWHNYFQGDLLAQSRKFNPSFFQDGQNHVISLSGFYFSLDQQGPSYWDFLKSDGNELINIGNALLQAKDQNFIRGDIEINTIAYTRNFTNDYLSIGHGVKLNGFINFPYDLLSLVANGNYQFIDKTVDIGPEFQLRTYHELNIGYGHRFGALSFGTNVKLISGIQDISTTKNSIELYTNPEFYQFEFMTDYKINSSSIINTDSLGNASFDFNGLGLGTFNYLNPGIAFDIGLSYEIGSFTVSASAVNIGRINWKQNPEQRISKGDYLFEGFEIGDFLKDTIAIFDSLSTIIGLESDSASYFTTLPRSIYASLDYKIENWNLGLLFGQEYYRNTIFSAAVINVKRTFNNKHSLALQYGIRKGHLFNLGFQGVFQLGPFQCFLGTDNIIGIIKPFDANYSNMRVGINLIIGQKKSNNDVTRITDRPVYFPGSAGS